MSHLWLVREEKLRVEPLAGVTALVSAQPPHMCAPKTTKIDAHVVWHQLLDGFSIGRSICRVLRRVGEGQRVLGSGFCKG